MSMMMNTIFFIVVNYHNKFTILTIFKCSLPALSTFALLCNHHHYPPPEVFHHPKLKLFPIKQ